MIPLYSTKIIRKVDGYAIKKLRIPGIVLMENASLEVFKFASEKLREMNKSGSIGFICGKGNNGGDGFAVARHFIEGYKIKLVHIGDEKELRGNALTNFQILKGL